MLDAINLLRMIVELYAYPQTTEIPQSPVSNTTGALPTEEPTLDTRDLLGSFSSREEALAYIGQQMDQLNKVVVETRSGPFNDYTHIEWLSMTIKTATQHTESRSYYLVTDEGY